MSLQDIVKKLQTRDFDFHRPCSVCGSEHNAEFMITKDKCRLVKCDDCGLVFTDPVLDLALWEEYLKDQSNPTMTTIAENRYLYGVAHKKNAPKTGRDVWRNGVKRKNVAILNQIEEKIGRRLEWIHEVGSGIGFLLEDALDCGIQVTGNELNAASCKIMREKMNLTIYNKTLEEFELPEGKYDAFIMDDVLEHVYWPRQTLEIAYKCLNAGGAVYLETFVIDCEKFEELGSEWNFLFWNHVTHFSSSTLIQLLHNVGFTSVVRLESPQEHIIILVAVK